MSTTSTAIFSNPLLATYSVYARNASNGKFLVHLQLSLNTDIVSLISFCFHSSTLPNQSIDCVWASLLGDHTRCAVRPSVRPTWVHKTRTKDHRNLKCGANILLRVCN